MGIPSSYLQITAMWQAACTISFPGVSPMLNLFFQNQLLVDNHQQTEIHSHIRASLEELIVESLPFLVSQTLTHFLQFRNRLPAWKIRSVGKIQRIERPGSVLRFSRKRPLQIDGSTRKNRVSLIASASKGNTHFLKWVLAHACIFLTTFWMSGPMSERLFCIKIHKIQFNITWRSTYVGRHTPWDWWRVDVPIRICGVKQSFSSLNHVRPNGTLTSIDTHSWLCRLRSWASSNTRANV